MLHALNKCIVVNVHFFPIRQWNTEAQIKPGLEVNETNSQKKVVGYIAISNKRVLSLSLSLYIYVTVDAKISHLSNKNVFKHLYSNAHYSAILYL